VTPAPANRPSAPLLRLLLTALTLHLSLFTLPCAFAKTAPDPSISPRTEIALTDNWRTAYDENDSEKFATFTSPDFNDTAWRAVSLPHNWDDYYGFRQVKAGHLYGHAWYRTTVALPASEAAAPDRRHFLFFEGVGSYATVWVNGQLVGKHAGGLTTFTLDITDALRTDGAPNVIAVRADHPPGIRDLPWVNGGSERAYGFSEGSQPFGIHRPVRLVSTASLRVEPFGVHVWADPTLSAASADLNVRTEIKNYAATPRAFQLVARLRDPSGKIVAKSSTELSLSPGETSTVAQTFSDIRHPELWFPAHPALYTLTTELAAAGSVLDRVQTRTGLRTISWPGADPASTEGRFFINHQPFLINGVAEYEHLLGQSHAFSDTQIRARVSQMEAAGFNAFRDAHHPHNLRYSAAWQRDGILWWTQFGTHIWFDNDAFRANFKTLLRDWVKERRNNPSLVLWGLQNESKLPADFAAECAAIIREMDPTATFERKITTCNGGEGADWNVPQNWTGTYGGDPETYAEDLRTQRLVGEYGAWRSLGFHAEGPLDLKGAYTEDRFTALLETKVRLAEAARAYASGHFMWLFTSHSNPGRNVGELGEQTRDGIRELDHIGPANNKGLLTLWGEPLDAFYMYRSNFAPKETDPMVVIASHTWPDRFPQPGKKSGIIVYSNCDEVELFNDLGQRSLGKRTRNGVGTHFTWDDVDIQTNTLYAEGRVNGKVVARDLITLHHLPVGPALAKREAAQPSLTTPEPGHHYLYRVNLGGPAYTDDHGNAWLPDRDYVAPSSSVAPSALVATSASEWPPYGTLSWAQQFPNLPPAFGSQRKIFDPILGARDDTLFQTFRYGRDQLRFLFDVPNSEAEYRIELFFTEPWYGTGGGDASGWRLFDVAVNGETKLHNLDIWKESGGRAHALKKVVTARSKNGRLEISFPRVASYQAVLSAIAIAAPGATTSPSASENSLPPNVSSRLFQLTPPAPSADTVAFETLTHLDTGDRLAPESDDTIVALPESLRDADWLRFPAQRAQPFSLTFAVDCDITCVLPPGSPPLDGWQPLPDPLTTPTAQFALSHQRQPAGSVLTIAPDSPARALIVKRIRPLPPAQSIVLINPVPGWRAVGNLKTGLPVHTDSPETFTAIPPILTDCDWLQSPDTPAITSGGQSGVHFSVNDHVEVYAAVLENQALTSNWFGRWIDTPLKIETSGAKNNRWKLFKRRLAPGDDIAVFVSGPLSVIVRPVRAATTLEAENAAAAGGAHFTTSLPGYTGTGAIALPPASGDAKPSLTWTITVGVGDRYGLNFRYATDSPVPLAVEQQIINADGTVLRTDTLTFPPTAVPLAWSVLRTRTGSSINAGTYRIRLTPVDTTAPLVLDSLEVE